ncbi:hypothetical protein [Blastococcus sp. SYSU DS0619]
MTRRHLLEWVLAGALGLAVLAGIVWVFVAVNTDGVPGGFEARSELPACGEVEWQAVVAGDGGPPAECLESALREGRGAELVVRSSTAEGDPITTYYRSLPDGGLEWWLDARDDGYASSPWTYARCPDATSLLAEGPCTNREF